MAKCLFTSRFKIAVCGTLSAAGLIGCLPRGTDYSQVYQMPGIYTAVDFSTLSAEVIVPKCITCHSEFQTEAGVLPYLVAGNPEASTLYTEITSGDMPPSGPALSQASVSIVSAYINGLVPAPSVETLPEPTPTFVTYDVLRKGILDSKCLKCHEEFKTEDGMKEYLVPGNPEKSPLYVSTASGEMPPRGPALKGDEMKMIKDYIDSKTAQ